MNNNINKSWSPKPEKNTPVKRKRTSAYQTEQNSEYNPNVNSPKSFMGKLENTQKLIYDPTYFKHTENGAIAYASSGSKLVDINFAVASLRDKNGNKDSTIVSMFREAFKENPEYAMRWLFFARDVRGGLGERHLFRVCMNDLAKNQMDNLVNALVAYIPEMGRWDDLWELLNLNATRNVVISCVKKQLNDDITNYKNNKNISLLAKWLPSENTSSEKTKRYGAIIRKSLKWTPKQYRQTLSNLRKYIDVVERKMSSQNWQAIDYETVPSRANLIYNKAFLRNDEDRRRAYLNALEKGEAKINASVLYPHDIVNKYHTSDGSYWGRNALRDKDTALEAMWKNLPNYELENTIVVADGSGSMTSTIGGTKVTALDVANALAIYCGERCKGEFKNTYITFSEKPQIVHLNANSLRNKIAIAEEHCEVANTNIEAVFNLILNTAINNNMAQDELPKQILIISDMEFDSATYFTGGPRWGGRTAPNIQTTLFQNISKAFNDAGYVLPKLIFWNVNSRTKAVPVTPNDGFPCALVSGFSPSIVKMVMSNEADPYSVVVNAIMDKRYDFVSEVIHKVYA